MAYGQVKERWDSYKPPLNCVTHSIPTLYSHKPPSRYVQSKQRRRKSDWVPLISVFGRSYRQEFYISTDQSSFKHLCLTRCQHYQDTMFSKPKNLADHIINACQSISQKKQNPNSWCSQEDHTGKSVSTQTPSSFTTTTQSVSIVLDDKLVHSFGIN